MEAAQGLPDPVDHPTSPELRALLATLLPACIMMDAVYENVTVCLTMQPYLHSHNARCGLLAMQLPAYAPMAQLSAAAWAPMLF